VIRVIGLACICLVALAQLQAHAQDTLGDMRAEGLGYARVVPGKAFEFPRDHGAHPDFRIEWWYLTANLTDQSGREWGLQWTLFRQALSPGPAQEGWHSNQMWMAHAAITTPAGHFHEQRFARGGIGQAGVNRIGQDGYFNAWMDDWQWRSQGADMFPAELSFSVDGREVSMLLEANGEWVANGDNGYSQKSAQGQASYYYSQPHIRVSGVVDDGLQQFDLAGQGWLDREWSSQALADDQPGWDWFSLHLDDGRKLMIYQVRQNDGDHWLSGSLIDTDGTARSLVRDDIELNAQRTGRIATGVDETRELPMEWRLALVDRDRGWRIRPLYDEQWMDTSYPYWEGVVLVEDERGERAGVGYMELTGY
jgi:predicted secreted hydrolase